MGTLRSQVLRRFFFFGCRILVPWPGIEPMPLAVKARVLTTGLPGNSFGRGFDESFPHSQRLVPSFVQGTPLLH